MKTIIILLSAVLLAACGRPDFNSEPIQMTIIKHVPDPSNWGCIGKNVRTVLRSEDGRVSDVCGDLGFDGDKVRSIDVYFGASYQDGAFVKQQA